MEVGAAYGNPLKKNSLFLKEVRALHELEGNDPVTFCRVEALQTKPEQRAIQK